MPSSRVFEQLPTHGPCDTPNLRLPQRFDLSELYTS
jgi:hypothetical protein